MADRFVVAVAGTRDYYPDDAILLSIQRLKAKHAEEGLVIVTGDAKGVDECAIGWAKEEGVPYICEKADWAGAGKMAGHERNERVVARAKMLLAFVKPGPLVRVPEASPGTCDAITQARDRAIPVHVHHEGRWLAEGAVQRIVDQTHQKWARWAGKRPEQQEGTNGDPDPSGA